MATLTPLLPLLSGICDSSGTRIASGKVRFYQPGGTTPQTVYSDQGGSAAITAPLTLTAAGTGTVYSQEAVRVVVKDSTETTTYVDQVMNAVRSDSLFLTDSGFNSGAETTLEAILAGSTTSFGAGFQYKPTSTATARNIKDVISDLVISAKDFGAVGNGTTDDLTVIQAAIDYVATLTYGGTVYFPPGNYKVTGALAIDTAKVSLRGSVEAASTITNASTTGNALSVDLGSAVDAKLTIRNLRIAASTTSSGSAIVLANGNSIEIVEVRVAGHRTGIDCNAVTGTQLDHVYVESTDDNAAAIGLKCGAGTVVHASVVTSATTNGTGIADNANAGVICSDCTVTKFATGIALSGVRSQNIGGAISTSTTGVALSGADTVAVGTVVTSATTGFSVGAGTRTEACRAVSCTTGFSLAGNVAQAVGCSVNTATTGYAIGAYTSCGVLSSSTNGATTNVTVNASAITAKVANNSFAPTLRSTGATPSARTEITDTGNYTPNLNNGSFLRLYFNAAAGSKTVTLQAPTFAAGALTGGEEFILTIYNVGASNLVDFDDTYYHGPGGTALDVITMANAYGVSLKFVCDNPATNTWIFYDYSGASNSPYTK